MRTPADPIDLRARTDAVLRRTRSFEPAAPVLDDDGLLRVGTSWVALTPSQAPVVQILLENLGKVVRFDDVVAVCEGAGASGHPSSVRTLVSRLSARLRTVGLDLVSVRRRGLLLTLGPRPDASGLSRHPHRESAAEPPPLGRHA
jgi:DNA-binding response OmpR family regulator